MPWVDRGTQHELPTSNMNGESTLVTMQDSEHESESALAVDRSVSDRLARTFFDATSRLDRGMLGRVDRVSLLPALARVGGFWAVHPKRAISGAGRYSKRVLQASGAAAGLAIGHAATGPVEPGRDKRFADPAWTENAGFWWLQQLYLLLNAAAVGLVENADVTDMDHRKAAFAARTLLDAVSPTNLAATNPAVLKRAFDTGGRSLAHGLRTFVRDVATQRRATASGRAGCPRGRPQHGGHAGKGGVPQRFDGIDPVHADDRGPCMRFRCCSARRGSTSTTSWTWPRVGA